VKSCLKKQNKTETREERREKIEAAVPEEVTRRWHTRHTRRGPHQTAVCWHFHLGLLLPEQ
jgi:phosphoenolpyruvate carboxylase